MSAPPEAIGRAIQRVSRRGDHGQSSRNRPPGRQAEPAGTIDSFWPASSGLVIAVSLVAAIPLYTHGTLERLLQTRLTADREAPAGHGLDSSAARVARPLRGRPVPPARRVHRQQRRVDRRRPAPGRWFATSRPTSTSSGPPAWRGTSRRASGATATSPSSRTSRARSRSSRAQDLPNDAHRRQGERHPGDHRLGGGRRAAPQARRALHLHRRREVQPERRHAEDRRHLGADQPGRRVLGVRSLPLHEHDVRDRGLDLQPIVLPQMPKALHEFSWYGVFDHTYIHSTNAGRVLSGLQFLETRAQLHLPDRAAAPDSQHRSSTSSSGGPSC